jgi:two-component system chemotaxis response regulator CheB
MKLIPEFPADFPGAIIVVQHMPGNFTAQFSKQLGEVSAMKVKEAEAGEIVVPGQVYVCPGANHLRVSATGRIVLDDGPRIGGYRPCADLTIESVVAYCGANAVAVILTGMGNDGSKGVQGVRAAGGHVIVQDESTAVIFGMPQEAIKTGAVDQVLPIDEIFSAVEKRVMSHTFLRAGALS